MCDCSRHTAGRAPETFPTGRSAARWGARIWGTLHDRLNASSTNYDAAAARWSAEASRRRLGVPLALSPLRAAIGTSDVSRND